jgi:hypothetical protein
MNNTLLVESQIVQYSWQLAFLEVMTVIVEAGHVIKSVMTASVVGGAAAIGVLATGVLRINVSGTNTGGMV